MKKNKVNPIVDNVTKELKDYESFAFNQNMMQVAIGITVANSFQKTVNAISECLIMPTINYFINNPNSNWRNIKFNPLPGMNLEIGHFLGTFIDFVICTMVLYFFWNKIMCFLFQDAKQKTKSK